MTFSLKPLGPWLTDPHRNATFFLMARFIVSYNRTLVHCICPSVYIYQIPSAGTS